MGSINPNPFNTPQPQEPLIGPGGEQDQQMHISPSAEGLMPSQYGGLVGPGGEQRLLGPGGVQQQHRNINPSTEGLMPSQYGGLVGPGGEQQLMGPGGVQQQHMNIIPQAEGLMPIPTSLSQMKVIVAQIKDVTMNLAQPNTELSTAIQSFEKISVDPNTTMQIAFPQFQQIANLVVGLIQQNPDIRGQFANILEPGPEIGS